MKHLITTFILTVLFLVSIFTLSSAQNTWDDHVVATPSVIFKDDTLRMWYNGNAPEPIGSIGYAFSVDGFNWNKYADNPILVHEPYNGWNEQTVYEPSVIFKDSIYHMWYTSADDLSLIGPIYIHHATSTDGLIWSKDTLNNPVLSPGPIGSWDHQWVDSHCIIFVDSIYHMWYADANGTYIRIGHATSSNGVVWTKDPNNPVLTIGTSGSWDYPRVEGPNVIFDGQVYHMCYSGGNHSAWRIGYATSSNGSTWTKADSVNPVLTTGISGQWDDTYVGFCSVLLDTITSTYRMWYTGSDTSLFNQTPWRLNGQIGYATSQDGISWVKDVLDNPVVTDIENGNYSKRPITLKLSQNYPNPFNPKTVIRYSLPVTCYLDLSIYNILGQKVATLVNKKQSAGKYNVEWDASGFASGIYYYQLVAGNYREVKKMILLR